MKDELFKKLSEKRRRAEERASRLSDSVTPNLPQSLTDKLAEMAQAGVEMLKNQSSGRPLSPVAWRHRSLPERESFNVKESSRTLTPQEQGENNLNEGERPGATAGEPTKEGDAK